MIVIDTSVFVDLLAPRDQARHKMAEEFFRLVERLDLAIYAPRLMVVELISVLKRAIGIDELVEEAVGVVDYVNLVGEERIFEEARRIALKIHPRAVDAYFIATAKLLGTLLVSDDRLMVRGAREYGIEAYFLMEEHEELRARLMKVSP